jgi:hypothetical protein
MPQECTPAPMSFRVAIQISTCHFLMNARSTSAYMTFLFCFSLMVMKLLGVGYPQQPLALIFFVKQFVFAHKLWFAGVYALIFALPSNLVALMVLTRYQFRNYRVYPVYHNPIVGHLSATPARKKNNRVQPRIVIYFMRLQSGWDELLLWLKGSREIDHI